MAARSVHGHCLAPHTHTAHGSFLRSRLNPAQGSISSAHLINLDFCQFFLGQPGQIRSRFTGYRRTAGSFSSQIIVAEPYPPPPSEALVSKPTTFVAAFAMPNADIPNNTDLRNFLVPLEALSSVSGMRFFGTGLLDETAKLSLDKEAIQVRERAGVPALSGDWGIGIEKTNWREKNGKDDQSLTTADRPRVFRHLCTTTSCRGL